MVIKKEILLLFIIVIIILSFSQASAFSATVDNPDIYCKDNKCTVLLDDVKKLAKYEVYSIFEISENLIHRTIMFTFYRPYNICGDLYAEEGEDVRVFDFYIIKNNEQILFKPYLDFQGTRKQTANYGCFNVKENDTVILSYYVGGKIKSTIEDFFYPFDEYSFDSWSSLSNSYYNRIDKIILPNSYVPIPEKNTNTCPGLIASKLVRIINETGDITKEEPLMNIRMYGNWYVYEGGGEGDFITEDEKRIVIWPVISAAPLDETKAYSSLKYNISEDEWNYILDERTGCFLTFAYQRTDLIKYFFFLSVLLISLSSIYFLWFDSNKSTRKNLYHTFSSSFLIWGFQEGLTSLTPLVRPSSITLFDLTLFIPILFILIHYYINQTPKTIKNLIHFLKEKSNFKTSNRKELSFLFIIIPSILLLIYFLPESIKEYLILHNANPNFVSVFLSNYTHSTLWHITNNIIAYLILIFLIFNVIINKENFHKNLAAIFVLVPIITSVFVLYYLPNLESSLGFSAITSALIGFLTFSVYQWAKRAFKSKKDSGFLWVLFVTNLFIWVVLNWEIDILIPLLPFILILYFLNRKEIKLVIKKIISENKKLKKRHYLEQSYFIIIFGLTVYFIFSFSETIVPSQIIFGDTVINVLSHYVGYILGVFIPIINGIIFKKK